MGSSPRSHIYRLLFVLLAVAIGFLGVRYLAIPESWDSQKSYRLNTLVELKELPMRIGGNEGCASSACHEDYVAESHQQRFELVADSQHRGLVCENCHGPVWDHAQDGEVVGYPREIKENEACMACHQSLLSRPEAFPQFRADSVAHAYYEVDATFACKDCHDPHDPKLLAVPPPEEEASASDEGDADDGIATAASEVQE